MDRDPGPVPVPTPGSHYARATVVVRSNNNICSFEENCLYGRRSRERRPPLSEIVTDTPAICQRDTGQRSRSAMVTPRHEGTPYLIEVTPRPGKYELHGNKRASRSHFQNKRYGAPGSEPSRNSQY